MADQPVNENPLLILREPGVAVIPFVNVSGTWSLYVKEVRRFFKVQLQTIWAPAVTTLLFLIIFSVALGRGNVTIMGYNFAAFIAPGLIVMGMMQNSFANASFALLVGKIQGTIIDYLMPPIANLELLLALVGASVTRALLVGLVVWLAIIFWPDVPVLPVHWWAVGWFGLMGSILLALLGILTSIWAEKFDHAAFVTNFIVQPLSLLSGTFYSADRLDGIFWTISHANPFFYVISGFRYGFLGVADSPIMAGALGLLGLNILLGLICYRTLASGWKLRA
jgi:ABC-2 type transport system permease protein